MEGLSLLENKAQAKAWTTQGSPDSDLLHLAAWVAARPRIGTRVKGEAQLWRRQIRGPVGEADLHAVSCLSPPTPE